MNEWIRKSIELTRKPGYLDEISRIYEMQINPKRPLPKEVVSELKKAFENKDSKKLICLLLKYAEVFPVKDSYIGYLKKKSEAIDENPITIERIAQRLYALGFEKMMEEAERPIETNRQLGNSFKKGLQILGYPFVDKFEFLRNNNDTLILEGGDKELSTFARTELKCILKKGIDLVIKRNGKYIIGEAKFLTTPGGEQDRGYDDAHTFINEKSGNAIRIAVLDGYIWIPSKKGLYSKIIQSEDNIMSALLLKEFIESL